MKVGFWGWGGGGGWEPAGNWYNKQLKYIVKYIYEIQWRSVGEEQLKWGRQGKPAWKAVVK